jgi:hypothetical protein
VRIRDALLNGLIDYAGLFPPAGEDMRTAVHNYAEYLRGPDRAALGRFIVPLARLAEFEDAAGHLLPREPTDDPWRISVLIADDVRTAVDQMRDFNGRHESGARRGSAIIDVAELKAGTIEEIAIQHRDLPRNFTSYFEIPLSIDVEPLVAAIAEISSRAKMRTGGLTAEAFPSPESIVDFMIACHAHGVAFKATAGLHHPIRAEYRYTYEVDSPRGVMYGYLNVFVTAALIAAGESEDVAVAALEEANPSAFEFHDAYLQWRDKRITTEQFTAVRERSAISFGSCSFTEPINELVPLIRSTQPVRT